MTELAADTDLIAVLDFYMNIPLIFASLEIDAEVFAKAELEFDWSIGAADLTLEFLMEIFSSLNSRDFSQENQLIAAQIAAGYGTIKDNLESSLSWITTDFSVSKQLLISFFGTENDELAQLSLAIALSVAEDEDLVNLEEIDFEKIFLIDDLKAEFEDSVSQSVTLSFAFSFITVLEESGEGNKLTKRAQVF